MAQLVGRKRLDFVSSEGQRVNGVKLQMLVLDSSVEGMACDMPFISVDSPAFKSAMEIPFGDVLIEYDRKGKVVAIVAK